MITTLTISGIHCNSCKLLISDVLSDVRGVTKTSVDERTGEVRVEHDDSVQSETLKHEIEALEEYRVLAIQQSAV